MKLKSIINIACGLLLLLSTLGSYGSSTDHGHRGQQVGRSSMIDAGGVISTAFSILEDAAMPEGVPSVTGSANLVRGTSDISLVTSTHTYRRANSHFTYFYCGQHAVLSAATPLFISIRRLLI